MKHYTRWIFALAILPVAACSSSSPAPTPMLAGPPPLAAADQSFIMAAAASDAGEIQAAQLAQTKAHSPRVKAFAAKMVTDHTASTQQLTTIATSKGVTIAPPAPSDEAKEMEAKLEADKPRGFDRDYARGQVASHKMAVQVFQTEIDSGQDPDLKAFAQSTITVIKQHLQMAERLSGHA